MNALYEGRCISLWVALVCVVCLFMLGACSKDQDVPSSQVVIAQMTNGAVTEDEFRSYLSERPEIGAGATVREHVEKRLQEVILEELLYQEAVRLKLDQAPEVRSRMRQLLIQTLMDQQINRVSWERVVPEDDILAYYQANQREFYRPEEVRIADLLIAVGATSNEKEKAAAKAKADALLVKAMATREKRGNFGRMIEQHSDLPKVYRKGDTGFFDIEGGPVGVDRKVARTAFELKRNGELFEEVIEAADGYHLIMRIGKRSAMDRPIEQARGQIEQRIRREEEGRARTAFFAQLKEQARIQIDGEAVKEVVREIEAEQSRLALAHQKESLSRQRWVDSPPLISK